MTVYSDIYTAVHWIWLSVVCVVYGNYVLCDYGKCIHSGLFPFPVFLSNFGFSARRPASKQSILGWVHGKGSGRGV